MGHVLIVESICAITEVRKTKLIDTIKDKTNGIIKKRTRGKKLVNFFANIEATWRKCSAF